MKEPTEAEVKEFWEKCGFIENTSPPLGYWSNRKGYYAKGLPPTDLNSLFKFAPSIIGGIYFRYYPGGCECELTYITEAGFKTVKFWVTNETNDESKSRELSALALFWAIKKVFDERAS